MHELAPLIKDLAIILGISGLVALLFQKIRQPVVLGYLVAGVIIGPYTPPHALVTDLPNIQTLSDLGVIFLMFALGLEFSFHKLKRVGFSAGLTGIWEVSWMLILGFISGLLLGWSFFDSLFLGAALSISSTTIIIKALEELKLKNKPFAEMIFGILIVEDLLAILLLVILSTVVSTSNIFSMELLGATLKLILVVGAWFLIGYFFVPSFIRRITPLLNNETLTIVSIALCLFLVCVADYFHYSTALGAFIMGSILAETNLIRRIEHLILPIRNIFAAVFFVSVGMLIDPMILFEQWPTLLLLCIVTIGGKFLITGIGAFLSGQSLDNSVRISMGMAQVGEFSFIIISMGLLLDVISPNLYPLIVGVSAVTTFTTPYLIRLANHPSMQLDKYLPFRVQYLINTYTEWMQRSSNNPSQRPLYRKAVIRLLLNGIIIAIIFIITENVIFPGFVEIINPPWLEKLLSWFVAILCSSPFIWGMLSAFPNAALQSAQKEDVQRMPVKQLVWLITLLELTILSMAFFDKWWISILFLITFMAVFTLLYKQLGNSYEWFEKKLIYNLQHKQVNLDNMFAAETQLIELQVGPR
ncbi:MAG: cation:proton antiporter, partial [Gammaproteobacteria bacterium]